MNVRRLKYFVNIVDIGSLTRAAEVLHIAQPALSQQLATLENELSQQLLIRSRRGVTPTEAGKILYSHARTILRQCEQAKMAVIHASEPLNGLVSLGVAPDTVASTLTLPLLQRVRKQFPGVRVCLHENSGASLNEKVIKGQLDMAVQFDSTPTAGITALPLLKEALFLVGTTHCPGPSVRLSDVAGRDLFLPGDASAVRKCVDEAFSLRQLSARIMGEIESTAMLAAAVSSGLGVTILPESAAREQASSGKAWMARITYPTLNLPLSLKVSARQPLSPSAQVVKNTLLSLLNAPVAEGPELTLVS